MYILNGERLLLKKIKLDNQKPGGLLASPVKSAELDRFEIKAIPDHYIEEKKFEVGDYVYLNPYATVIVKLGNVEFFIIDAREIYLIEKKQN